MKNTVMKILTQIRIYRAFKNSGVFDCQYYLCSNPDVANCGTNPIKHYIRHGCHEGRNPNAFFDTRWYLKTYPRVARAGMNPLYHYLKYGASEGYDPSPLFSTRGYLAEEPNAAKSNLNPLAHYLKHSKDQGSSQGGFAVPVTANTSTNTVLPMDEQGDRTFLACDVPISRIVSHDNWRRYLYEIGNKPGMKILEIGSREVTGKSNARKDFAKAEYVGFDYYPGNNVDVVGDAHKLSSYFKLTHEKDKFDIIYSSACFEHFAMPWIVATEIAKLLKVGGLVFIETHFSYSSHERPWHFFQFSDMALKVLFSESLGFQCVEAGMSNPIVGRFSSLADADLRNKPVRGLYCHSEYLGKKIKDIREFDWAKVDLKHVVGNTKYPQPKEMDKSDSLSGPATVPQRYTYDERKPVLVNRPPAKLMTSIGGGFEVFGPMRTKLFIEEYGLRPTDNVLDVGCGCGRIATYLTTYLTGTYEGFDIMGDCIEWCQKAITPKYPNFRFKKIDVYNKEYNPAAKIKASDLVFPYEDEFFDFIFLTSVFSHMFPDDMNNYLKEIKRVLKTNGKCLITYFLINPEALSLISENKTRYKFKIYSDNVYALNEKNPEAAIGFDEEYIKKIYSSTGLKIKEVRHGNWCGRESKLRGQDLIYSIKQ